MGFGLTDLKRFFILLSNERSPSRDDLVLCLSSFPRCADTAYWNHFPDFRPPNGIGRTNKICKTTHAHTESFPSVVAMSANKTEVTAITSGELVHKTSAKLFSRDPGFRFVSFVRFVVQMSSPSSSLHFVPLVPFVVPIFSSSSRTSAKPAPAFQAASSRARTNTAASTGLDRGACHLRRGLVRRR